MFGMHPETDGSIHVVLSQGQVRSATESLVTGLGAQKSNWPCSDANSEEEILWSVYIEKYRDRREDARLLVGPLKHPQMPSSCIVELMFVHWGALPKFYIKHHRKRYIEREREKDF